MNAKKALTAGLALTLLGIGTPPVLSAAVDNMRSDSYIIQFGNFNMTSGEKSSSAYKVTDTVGQTAPGEYTSTGYKVFAGFQYIYAIPRFSFRITDLSIELGELQNGVFSQQSNDLVITTRSGGYSILARAENPLRRPSNISNAQIPFTSCDAGCTISNALPWTDPFSVGLGFTVAGTHKASDFINNTYYRPFADRSQSQAAQVIAQSNDVVKDDVVNVTYRATVAGSQEAGQYQTSVEYTAIPTF